MMSSLWTLNTILLLFGCCWSGIIDTNYTSQYNHKSIDCKPGEDCTIICDEDNACYRADINCPSNYSCNIQCITISDIHGISTCRTAKFNCIDSSECNIECKSNFKEGYPCYDAIFNWPSNKQYSLICEGGRACYRLTIDSPTNHQPFQFNCTGDETCADSIINCPTNAPCNIRCDGYFACNSISIQCPQGGDCHIECMGDRSCENAEIIRSPNAYNASLICQTQESCSGVSFKDSVTIPPTTSAAGKSITTYVSQTNSVSSTRGVKGRKFRNRFKIKYTVKIRGNLSETTAYNSSNSILNEIENEMIIIILQQLQVSDGNVTRNGSNTTQLDANTYSITLSITILSDDELIVDDTLNELITDEIRRSYNGDIVVDDIDITSPNDTSDDDIDEGGDNTIIIALIISGVVIFVIVIIICIFIASKMKKENKKYVESLSLQSISSSSPRSTNGISFGDNIKKIKRNGQEIHKSEMEGNYDNNNNHEIEGNMQYNIDEQNEQEIVIEDDGKDTIPTLGDVGEHVLDKTAENENA